MIISENARNTVMYKGKELKIRDAFVNAAYAIDHGPLTEISVEHYFSFLEEDVIANATTEQLSFALEYGIRDEFCFLCSNTTWNFFKDEIIKDYSEGKYLEDGEFVVIRDDKIIRHPAPKVAKPTGICDCPHCLARTPYFLQKKEDEIANDDTGVVFKYFKPIAICKKCGSENVYVEGLNEMQYKEVIKAVNK